MTLAAANSTTVPHGSYRQSPMQGGSHDPDGISQGALRVKLLGCGNEWHAQPPEEQAGLELVP